MAGGVFARSRIPRVSTNESDPSHTPVPRYPHPSRRHTRIRVLRGIKAIATVRTISIVQKVGASRSVEEVNRLIIRTLCRKSLRNEKVGRFLVERIIKAKEGSCYERRIKIETIMIGCISFTLIAIASTVAMAESRVIPAEPVSITLGAYGNPVMFLREKRMAAVRPYPHRTMMFTGYYRPIRRTNNGQATGVFAQGNAVSGETYFGGMHTPHLKGGPEPIEESEVSSAQAQAAPAPEEEQGYEYHHHRNEVHRHEEEEQPHRDEPHYHHHHHHHHQDSLTPQGHHESDQIPLTTEITRPTVKPITATEVTRPKLHHTRKTHKTPVAVNTDDDDDDDDDEDEEDENEEDDGPIVPFVPFKGNRRRQGYPHLNNFFPMVFSFPRLATRAGSSGSLPGAITAIANSYSTGKGGVASSVATAYGGGSPTGKKQRPQPYKE